jgi:hypothetical protein
MLQAACLKISESMGLLRNGRPRIVCSMVFKFDVFNLILKKNAINAKIVNRAVVGLVSLHCSLSKIKIASERNSWPDFVRRVRSRALVQQRQLAELWK